MRNTRGDEWRRKVFRISAFVVWSKKADSVSLSQVIFARLLSWWSPVENGLSAWMQRMPEGNKDNDDGSGRNRQTIEHGTDEGKRWGGGALFRWLAVVVTTFLSWSHAVASSTLPTHRDAGKELPSPTTCLQCRETITSITAMKISDSWMRKCESSFRRNHNWQFYNGNNNLTGMFTKKCRGQWLNNGNSYQRVKQLLLQTEWHHNTLPNMTSCYVILNFSILQYVLG